MSLLTLLTLLVGGIAWSAGELSTARPMMVQAIWLAVLSLIGFLWLGRGAMNAASIASFCVLVFGAGSAIYTGSGEFPLSTYASWKSAYIVVLLFTVFQLSLISFGDRPPGRTRGTPRSSLYAGKDVGTIGVLVALLAILLQFVDAPIFPTPLIVVSIGLLTMASAGAKSIKGRLMFGVVTAATFGAYANWFFEGFGRLNLAATLFMIVYIWSSRFPSLWTKLIVVSVTIPGLAILSMNRVKYIAESQGRTAGDLEGIGSVVGPFGSVATIVQALLNHSLEPSWGATLVVAALFWVPSSIWTTKPPGFGREIVPITQPNNLAAAEFSDAGMITGEAVWNFGPILGAVFLIAVAVGICRLERMLNIDPVKGGVNLDRSRNILVRAIFASSTLQIVWGGMFTWAARTTLPLVIAGIILPIAFTTLRNLHRHVRW